MRLNRLSLVAVGFALLACGTNGDSGNTGGSGAGGQAGDAGKAGGTAGGEDARGGSGGAGKGGTGGTVATGSTGGDSSKGGTGGTGVAGGTGGTSPEACAMSDFTGLARDFNDSHPDFQPLGGPDGSEMNGAVKADLDADGKPVWALPGGYVEPVSKITLVQGKDSFAEWFRSAGTFNMSAEFKLGVTTQANGSLLIGTQTFFPIDGKLLGNKDVTKQVIVDDDLHNHLFTAELIIEFEYQGNGKELLIVGSDDDSWVFVNNKLAIDNGGLHGITVGNIPFQARAAELGLLPGKRYKIHFFMADRHLTGSAFTMTAVGMKFTNCKPIMPVK